MPPSESITQFGVGTPIEIRPDLTNKGESKSFLRTALAVKGSASPGVTRRVIATAGF